MSSSTRLTDELEIRNLVARVAHAADTASIEDYAELFTEDAVWSLPGTNVVGLPANERRGRDAIVEGAAERRAAQIQGPGTNTRHIVSSTAVEFKGADAARATSYWTFVVNTVEAPSILSVGQYDDEFRRTGDGWRMAGRQITVG